MVNKNDGVFFIETKSWIKIALFYFFKSEISTMFFDYLDNFNVGRGLVCRSSHCWAPNRVLFEIGNDSTRVGSSFANQDGLRPQLPPLVVIGDRELMSPCPPFDFDASKSVGERNGNSIDILRQCQKKYGGIGIAACQVGWRTRIFCMGIEEEDESARARYPDAPTFPFQVWINPTITPILEEGMSWFWEGCLSVPGMRGWVERPNDVKICGWNEKGVLLEIKILFPCWQGWWAYVLYGLFVIGSAGVIMMILRRRWRLQEELKMEQ